MNSQLIQLIFLLLYEKKVVYTLKIEMNAVQKDSLGSKEGKAGIIILSNSIHHLLLSFSDTVISSMSFSIKPIR